MPQCLVGRDWAVGWVERQQSAAEVAAVGQLGQRAVEVDAALLQLSENPVPPLQRGALMRGLVDVVDLVVVGEPPRDQQVQDGAHAEEVRLRREAALQCLWRTEAQSS